MRITIQEKKITVTRLLINNMIDTLNKMNKDLDEQTGEIRKAFLEAHFEKIRCDSGNLNEILEGNRFVLNLFFEGTLIDEEVKIIIEKLGKD